MFRSFYDNLECSVEDDYRILSHYSTYANKGAITEFPPFVYADKNDAGLLRIQNEWSIDNVMGKGTELQRILNLKNWAVTLLCFPGKKLESRRYDSLNCFDTINTAKQEGYALNCRYIALIFTQILLSAGFKARWVSCLPFEINYNECHCVTEVFLNDFNKWIVVDLSFNLLYFDKAGNILNLYEIKNHIINKSQFRICASTKERFKYIYEYWCRHVFRFKFMLNNQYNMLALKNKAYAFLNPKDFRINNKEIHHSKDDVTRLFHYYDNRVFWEG